MTALICTSDILALGALAEAGRRGLRVPADLSVTGFDGIPDAERAGLTTVYQPVREKGRSAGALLLDPARRVRANPTSPQSITLETELRIGTTSAPPRTAEQHWFGP